MIDSFISLGSVVYLIVILLVWYTGNGDEFFLNGTKGTLGSLLDDVRRRQLLGFTSQYLGDS